MSEDIKMVKCTVNGNQYEFKAGTTILEACRTVGIKIPHYCYHRELSIAGACRMCLVEIEKIPKLQIACYMTVGDDMVIHTENERVKKARQAMLEFHLVNHPLDCPVCDQAGECKLQEYYMLHGKYMARLQENKVKKHKKGHVLGPHVMLDQERCILCSRCVRFTSEISKTNQLGMFERGDREEIDVFPGQPLTDPYSGNVIDICPVGALTEKDFRFKTRVWFLETTDSVCTRCSRGCNITIHHKTIRTYKNDGKRINRLKPRRNNEVNRSWICDEGRFGFGYVDDINRITDPLINIGGNLNEPGWKDTLVRVADELRACASGVKNKEAAFLVSPQATNEELHLMKRVLDEQLPGSIIAFSSKNSYEPTEDDILRKADKNPNTSGAELLGVSEGQNGVIGLDELKNKIDNEQIGVLFIAYNDIFSIPGATDSGWQSALAKVDTVVFMGTNSCSTSRAAQVVLPAAAFAELDGTVTNFAGRVQRLNKAFAPLGESLPGWKIWAMLGEMLGGSYSFDAAEDVFTDLAAGNEIFSGLNYETIGSRGVALSVEKAQG